MGAGYSEVSGREQAQPRKSDFLESQLTVGDRIWLLFNQPFGALILLLLCVIAAFFLYERGIGTSPTPAEVGSQGEEVFGAGSVSVSDTGDVVVSADDGDIYWISAEDLTPRNITQSAMYVEVLPVFSPEGDMVAFVAVSLAGERSLRVWGNGRIWDVTYQSKRAGLGEEFCIDLDSPPRWSPDGKWLAFLAEQCDGEGISVEVFVASLSGDALWRVSNRGNVVQDVRWLDTHSLVYSERRGDGLVAVFLADIAHSPPSVEEIAGFPK